MGIIAKIFKKKTPHRKMRGVNGDPYQAYVFVLVEGSLFLFLDDVPKVEKTPSLPIIW